MPFIDKRCPQYVSRAGNKAALRESESIPSASIEDIIPLLEDVVCRPGPLAAFRRIAEGKARYSQVRAATKLHPSQFSRTLKILEGHGLVRRVEEEGDQLLTLLPRGLALDELLVLLPAAFEDFERAATRRRTAI